MDKILFPKWKKIAVLFEYLGQGRTIGVDGCKYGLSIEGKLISIGEDANFEVSSMSELYMMVDSLTDQHIILMGVEIVITREGKDKAKSREEFQKFLNQK